ncbi:MAG: hypothetical protein JWO77_3505, partial [Ilumatobacteraceae bacterium]|nr:hypothetical protein [Ilumatobacteraceae bacterium]
MQTDQSIDSATATSRRTFLTRTAGLGALVSAGALVLPGSPLATSAGARPAEQGTLKDPVFAAFGINLELAAVAAYTAAFDKGVLDDEWSDTALQFQGHHQDVADTLIELRDPDAPEPVAEAALAERAVSAITAATDQNGVLLALAEVEETCAATHLSAIGKLAEKSTARTVCQVLAVEGQQAALLAVAAGTAIAEVTPVTNSGDAALTIPTRTESTASTTTTAAGATEPTGDSQDPDASPETDNNTGNGDT